jgi:hypothetical protein
LIGELGIFLGEVKLGEGRWQVLLVDRKWGKWKRAGKWEGGIIVSGREREEGDKLSKLTSEN